MIKILNGFYVHISFFLIFIISFFTGTFYETSGAFLMALCHELAHLLCALYLKERCHGIALMPYGCRLFLSKTNSLSHEFFIALSGPLFNFLMLFLFSEGILYDVNLAMLIINLFPIMPLDGGRMCYALLSLAKGPFMAIGLIKRISFFGGIFLILLGIYQAIFTGFNLSVLTSGAFLLFNAITDDSKIKIFKNSLTGERVKVKDTPKKAFFLAAEESIFARKILEHLPAEKYTFLAVLDKKGRFSGLIGEEEIFRRINEEGALVKIGDILKKA